MTSITKSATSGAARPTTSTPISLSPTRFGKTTSRTPADRKREHLSMKQLLLLTVVTWLAIGIAPVRAADIDYARDIKPIFAEHCYQCHGVDKQRHSLRVDNRSALLRGGDSGEPGVIPGDADGSYLIKRLTDPDSEHRMPFDKPPLPAAQIDLIKQWIKSGAQMPGDDGPLDTTTHHWSFQPVIRPPVPAGDAGDANPIDAFIGARLREKGLSFSPEADRRTLIRRLYLVMLGLPPTPQQIDAFVADTSADAWAKLVDQVLASPHYGERWAQHWLDVVRYADTHGFEVNTPREDAWPYRDWVIAAINSDMPYDQFMFDQVAGDSVRADAATGMLVAGPVVLPGQVGQDEASIKMARHDQLDEIVKGVSGTFLGLTIGCAKCHNHKFDPITQADYYKMQAIFSGVHFGSHPMRTDEDPDRAAKRAAIAAQIEQLQKRLSAMASPACPGRTIMIDDEDIGRVELLAEKAGNGVNPEGVERGFAGDPGGVNRVPNLSGGRYTWFQGTGLRDVMAYRPQASGRFRVWLSWGCGWHTHCADARYVLDTDGDPSTTDDQRVIATVDQRLFADGSGQPGSTPLWSGLYDAGVHEMTPTTRLILRRGESGVATTADLVVFQEEPAGAADPIQPHLRRPVDAAHNLDRFAPTTTRSVRFVVESTNNGNNPCIDELEVFAGDRNVALASLGVTATSSGDYDNGTMHRLLNINDGLGGNDHSWISSEAGRGWVALRFADPVTIDRVAWARDREGRFNDRLAVSYHIDVMNEDGSWRTVAGSTDRLAPMMVHAPLDQLALSGLGGAKRDEAVRAIGELANLQSEAAKLTPAQQTVYAGVFSMPETIHRLYRGDAMSPREQVAPDTPTALGTLGMTVDAPDVDRRVTFGRWLGRADNPLTPRVIVNRIWQGQFGAGLVATPSDFGGNGVAPTHPQLLDWLAAELIEHGWSLKYLHRLILTSRTWRQADLAEPKAMVVDSHTQLLWRYPPHRLAAEPIRDSMLGVSDLLDPSMGGPGFSMYEPNDNYVRNYEPLEKWGPAEFRRMIYAAKVRMEVVPVVGAFDCPDAGQSQPKRARSTTPIQALNLFNSTFTLTVADHLAQRIRREAGDDPKAQIDCAFRIMFGRKPTATEQSAAVEFLDSEDLAALARVLLNTNEFLFIP
ncbi:MAG: DUF1553 domain-containing protein [Planctomycetes bacterium]|nr:DUF1553 domain-containing protein [Planctomycetota bacterium]